MKNKIIEILTDFDVKPSYAQTAVYDQSISGFRKKLATRIMEQLGECYVECGKDETTFALYSLETRGLRKYLKKLPPHPKEETDWNKLREQYFEECCEIKAECYVPPPMDVPTSMKRVAMAPHDLFAWFERRLSNPLKEEPKDSGWISVAIGLPENEDSVICFDGDRAFPGEYMKEYTATPWYDMDAECFLPPHQCVTHWMPLPDPPTVETKKD